MKQFLMFILISSLCALMSSSSLNSGHPAEAVVSVANISDPAVFISLTNEFSKMNGVLFCETSLQTKSLVVQFDNSRINPSDITAVLHKWGGEVLKMDFRSLSFND